MNVNKVGGTLAFSSDRNNTTWANDIHYAALEIADKTIKR
jgi:hypothetical protein